MQPIPFPEQNSVHVAEGCVDLPTYRDKNEQFGTDEVISLWELSNEDIVEMLKQIKAGVRPSIYLSVIGGQPPVSLFLKG